MSAPSSKKKTHVSAGAVVRTYVGFVKRYPILLATFFIGATGLQAAELISPWYLRQFFNALALNVPSPTSAAGLIHIIIILAFVYLFSQVMRRMQDFSIVFLEARVMSDIFERSFGYLLGHSYNFFVSRFSGSLTHRITKFARAFEAMFDSVAYQFYPTLLFICGAVTVLYIRNAALGTALALWSLGFISFQLYVAWLMQPIRMERSEADTKVTATLADSISNHPTILLFSGEKHEQGIFGAVVDSWRQSTIRTWVTDNLIWGAIGLFMLGIEIGLLWGATILWGKGVLTIGDFVLIQAYLMTTFDRLISINRDLRRFHDAFADASEMVEIMQMQHEVRDKANAKPLKVNEGRIEFKKVGFRFNAEQAVFSDLDISIAPGEKVALVGPSGAGKSTITKLILRFFDVKQGSIEIDGQNIARVTQESLRDAIGFVPQEPILFHRSLMENIRYGRRDATDEEVIDAAKRAHCHDFISHLPGKYETFVGERGVKLSGGERQRVAIARAILKNAPILMLDEATSSLDSHSEVLIQEALAELMRGKTVLVIAHRLSTIMKMDRIIVLKDGAVVEEGRHNELVEKGGEYAELWRHQAGGFLKDEE